MVWRPDNHNLGISEMAKDLHDELLDLANTITSEDTRNRFIKRVNMLDQKKYRDIMIKDAGSDKSITVEMDAFNRDKYLFNCHNGTIDLRTMEFRKHTPSDRLTKVTEVSYNPDAVCQHCLTFMDEVFEGDQECVKYLQKAIGYAMSGDTRLECMFILYDTKGFCNGYVKSDDFPDLKPGKNHIAWSGAIDCVEITPRWWTLRPIFYQ